MRIADRLTGSQQAVKPAVIRREVPPPMIAR
jgi:hypothetical protein